MSTQKVYIKAMCFKKASQVKEVLHTFMKNFGKIDKVAIIDTDTIDGQDGNCASTFHAIVIFKANVILNKIQSTSKVKIFLCEGLPDKLSLDTLMNISVSILNKEALKKVEHELEIALRLFRVEEYSDSASSFNTILKLCSSSSLEVKSRFFAVILYCRCLALLKSKKVDDINDGYQMLQSNMDLRSSFPLLVSLMSKYEIALRKPISVHFHAKKKDLPKWPFQEMFIEVFKEANPENISLVIEELNQMMSEAKTDPKAVCRYENCKDCFDKQAWSGLLFWSNFIRTKDVDYKGYYRLTCQDRCKIEFHPYCWKEQKGRQGLKNDKEFLNMPCLTPDCNGVIIEIVRFPGSNVAKPVILKADQMPVMAKPLEIQGSKQSSIPVPAEDSNASLLNMIKEHIDKEVEHSRVVNDLKAENEKLIDQLANARNEAKAAKESLKIMRDKVNKREEILAKTEDKIRNVNADIKAEKDKYRRLEYDFKKAQNQQEYQLKNALNQQNLHFIQLLEEIQNTIPDSNSIDFKRLIKQVQNSNFQLSIREDINCNEEMMTIKKPNLLDKILVAAQEAFPRQTKDNILTMIMEIKRSHGGLKSLTMNKLIMEMQDMLNSNLDDECSICLESLSDDLKEIIALKCKHEFHFDCIHKYFAIKMECPLCRSFEVLDEEFPSLAASLVRRKQPRRESASSSVNSM